MNGDGEAASQRGRFAAREFLARWCRETGATLSPTETDRLLFTYEMGYLRGRSDAAEETMKMFDDAAQARQEEERTITNADSDPESK